MLLWKPETATPRYAFLFMWIESQPPHWEQRTPYITLSLLISISSSSYISPLFFFTYVSSLLSVLVQMFFCFSPLLHFSSAFIYFDFSLFCHLQSHIMLLHQEFVIFAKSFQIWNSLQSCSKGMFANNHGKRFIQFKYKSNLNLVRIIEI